MKNKPYQYYQFEKSIMVLFYSVICRHIDPIATSFKHAPFKQIFSCES